MRSLIPLVCLLAAAPAWGQVIPRGQLRASYQLVLENSQAYLVGTFQNLGKSPLVLEIPAGVRFLGQREPCNPTVIARDMTCNLAPGANQTIKVEALYLSFYPHTAGPYHMDRPDEESARLGRRVYLIWKRHKKSPFRNSPIRLIQAAVYLENGEDRTAIQKRFSGDELRELQEVSP